MVVRAANFNQGERPTLAFVNLATVDLGASFRSIVAALKKFLHDDFGPVWFNGSKRPAKIKVYKSIAEIPAGEWPFLFIDDADTAGALGYHDLTKDGQPVSKVFAKTALENGESVSVTACHELAEVLIDPGAQLWAQQDDNIAVAYETADPVEEQTYQIDGIAMSNFVYPSYFENFHAPGTTKLDHLALLKAPFEIAPGGYLIISKGGQVSEIFGSTAKRKRFEREDRRQHRSEYRKPIKCRK